MKLAYRGDATILDNENVLLDPMSDGSIPGDVTIWKEVQVGSWKWSSWSPNDNIVGEPSGRIVKVDKKQYTVANPNDETNMKGMVDMGLPPGVWKVTVYSLDPGIIRGQAVPHQNSTPRVRKFIGECVLFSSGASEDSLNRTASHEFTHGLGMGHNCGYSDYKGDNTCCMTYNFYEPRNNDGSIVLWNLPEKQPGLLLCPFHIKAIRETRLEDEQDGLRLEW